MWIIIKCVLLLILILYLYIFIGNGVKDRILTTLLTEMDGIEHIEGVIVMVFINLKMPDLITNSHFFINIYLFDIF